MKLSVELYDLLEKEGMASLPNRFVEAFKPETFERIGFSVKIYQEKEIVKYIDSQHGNRLKWYVDDWGMAPTKEEFDRIKNIENKISDYTFRCFGRREVVKAPMIEYNR